MSALSGAPQERLGRRPALDGLRAVAILFVLLHHTADFLAPSLALTLFPGGFLGVDLFMVLSGFLITTLLLERRGRERRPIGTFYLRRVLRLIPALVVLLLANLLYAAIVGRGVADALRSIGVVMLYVTNWAELAGISISSYVTHLWSLAIEEQFYLVWPLLLFVALRLLGAPRRVIWVAVAIALAAAVWRAILFESGDPWLRIYIRTDTRADSLAIGALLALLGRDRWSAAGPSVARSVLGVAALVALIAAAALIQPYAPFLYLGGFTLVAIVAAILIACVLDGQGPLARALSLRPVVWVGVLSYSLYLWHFGIFQIVASDTGSWSAAPRVLLAWGLTFAVAFASYRLVEQPALTLKRRLGRSAPAPRPSPQPQEALL
jgi:peptidoglycan/LPS O-acetylase OafA/YrhL